MSLTESEFLGGGGTSMSGTFNGTLNDTLVTTEGGNIREENTFKILIATDIHLGYCDNNPARGKKRHKFYD
jgi:hypothetical protein